MSVTAVINGHREGRMLSKSVESALVAKSRAEFPVDLHIVLDRPDSSTRQVAHEYDGRCKISEVDYGDLGRSRNFGVNLATSDYVAFLDGDDLWSANWLTEAFMLARKSKIEAIVHPELNVYFNDANPRRLGAITGHVTSVATNFNLSILAQTNYWTALSFGRTSTYLDYPFRAVDPILGNGFEDWAFNLETYLGGVEHIVAQNTAHFIRDKTTGSMRRSHASRHAVYFPFSYF